MKHYLRFKCDDHKDPHNCCEYIVARFGDKIGIPIRDSGSSYTEIQFCPWCGTAISLRDVKEN